MDALIYGNMVQIAYTLFSTNTKDITNTDINPDSGKSLSQLWPGGWRPLTFLYLQKTATTPDYIRQNELFGFIAVNDASNTAAVILRGTQTPEDWIVDLMDLPEQDHDLGGNVEGGFNECYKALVTDTNPPVSLDAYLLTLTQTSIIISGHSLGSSLATLAAATLAHAGKNNLTVYLFASPKTGNNDFVTGFNAAVPHANCTSYINVKDIVPMVPPLYSHVGNIISLDSKAFPAIQQTILCYHTLLDYLYMLDQVNFFPPPSCAV
jgi:predicted lipase